MPWQEQMVGSLQGIAALKALEALATAAMADLEPSSLPTLSTSENFILTATGLIKAFQSTHA